MLQSQAAVTALGAAGSPAIPAAPPGQERAAGLSSAGGNRVTLVCLANFAFTVGFLRGLERAFPLPETLF